MQTHTLGEARYPSPIGHKVSVDIRIPERIIAGADPGLLFELNGPMEKLFFNSWETVAGIVTCGGLCPGLHKAIYPVICMLSAAMGASAWTGGIRAS